MENPERPQLIEQTSKKIKAAQAAGGLLIVLGFGGIILAGMWESLVLGVASTFASLLGIGVSIAASLLAWWRHG